MSNSTWHRIRFVKFIPKYHSTFPFRSRVHSKKEDPALSAISVHRKFPVKFKTKTKVFFKKRMRTHQYLCKYCFRITCIFYFVLLYAKTMRPSVKRATRTFQCSGIANRMLCVLSQPEVLITKLSLEQTFISSLKNNEYII